MKPRSTLLTAAALYLGVVYLSVLPSSANASEQGEEPRVRADYARKLSAAPLAFTRNMGQWPDSILYRSSGSGATMWFTATGAYYQLFEPTPKDTAMQSVAKPAVGRDRTKSEADGTKTTLIKASFVGANTTPVVVGEDETSYKCNFFIGSDPRRWRSGVPNHNSIVYRNLYAGIDLKYYGNGHQMEYDFLVAPGADYSQIQIRYDGAKSMSINISGELVIETDCGMVIERRPVVYQTNGSAKRELNGQYVLIDGNRFSFKLADGFYNRDLALVIDPALVYSTFLGGDSSTEAGQGIAIDSAGNAYVTGETSSVDFPTENPYDNTRGGFVDAFVTKLTAGGNALAYSTYLGGSNEDWGCGIAVDAFGNAYVTGRTGSADFPTLNAYDGNLGGSSDAFVTKLAPEGNALIYSTYLGGSSSDWANALVANSAGNAYIAGETFSVDFPTLNAYDGTLGGSRDAFVTKLAPDGNALTYSTYLGGSIYDGARALAVDTAGNAYITGFTWSADFPILNAYDSSLSGNNAFVTKLAPGGNALVYSTYLGGSAEDLSYGIAVDAAGNAYVTGSTESADFPVLNAYDSTLGSAYYTDAFVTKLAPGGNALVYSTFLGGSKDDYAAGIAVDAAGSAYVAGQTASTDFPTLKAYDNTLNFMYDAFVTRLAPAGNALVYSTYLGGNYNEWATGIKVDAAGDAYVTGSTGSSDFPHVNAYDGSLGDSRDAFVTKLPPVCLPNVDSDGDAMQDCWEIEGYDDNGDGVPEVNLPAMGANPQHKDIFVEVDWMEAGPGESKSHKPMAVAIDRVVQAFANSPVNNPDGQTGITLHVDYGQGGLFNGGNEIAHLDVIVPNISEKDDWSNFSMIKRFEFAKARYKIFRYCVFGCRSNSSTSTQSGITRDIPHSDFTVTLGGWRSAPGTELEQAGTFMHELGHCLGLRHGGDEPMHFKPNYLSVMNYAFQVYGLIKDSNGGVFDYSRFVLPPLDENALDERIGLNGGPAIDHYGTRFSKNPDTLVIAYKANGPIDWDQDGIPNEPLVQRDINWYHNLGGQGRTVLKASWNDWSNLTFKGGLVGTGLTENDLPLLTSHYDEITEEINAEIPCCIGVTGNVNYTGIVDLADLSALVSYLTGGGYVLPCLSEANVNATGITDLADLSALVSYLTGGGYVLPNCP